MNRGALNIDEVFFAALALEDRNARSAYLDEICGGDTELRNRLDDLLAVNPLVSQFLESPAIASAATIDQPRTEGPGTLIGPYKLLEQIGEGGMGSVYVAEQSQPVRRRVALKLIKLGMDTRQVIARFEAERQALAMMDHPNIAKVLDAGATEAGRPYFVMELVRGIPITDYCDREQLSIPERLELFVLVCRAVQHAHQKGIIHRDLKPSNILVTVIDGAAVPKVIDFGVAKATGASLTDRTIYTAFHQFVGTPLYMSPEQADLSGMDMDTRSDIYSLGVLLYELLTGTTPFDQETFRQAAFDEIRRMIREDEPPRPSTRLSSLGATRSAVSANRKSDARHLDRTVHGELDWIVMKALEKDRRRRYETANDFASDVMRHLTDQPVEACPPSGWYRLRKYGRRNRTPLMAAAGILIVVTLLCVTAGLFLREKSIHQSRIEGEVRLALRDAELFQQQKKWADASAAAKRAQGLLRSGPASEALRQLVEERVSDLTLAAELELILTDRLSRLAERAWSTLSDSEIDARYERAFREAGIDVQKLSVAEAAEMIRRRGVRAELAASLDMWTTVRQATIGGGRLSPSGRADPRWMRLQELATAVDPDPFRVQLRKSWAEFNVPDAKRIATSPEIFDQPMAVLMSQAMGLMLTGRDEGWRELLHKLNRRHPEDFWINFCLANESSDPVDSLRFSTAAVAIRPKNAGAHLALGHALRGMKRYGDSITAYREALRLKKDFHQAHNDLGVVLRDNGRLEEAIVEYREALRIEKDHAPAHLNLGRALASKGQLDEALPSLNEAIRLAFGEYGLDPEEQSQAHNALGLALVQQGKVKEALASWKLALRSNRNNHDAHNSMAWYLATCADPRLRDPKEAVRHAGRATALVPDDWAYWNTLGVAQYRNGDSGAALDALRKSIKLHNGGEGTDFFFLAMAHQQLGHTKEAGEYFHKAIQWMDAHNPDDADMRLFRAEAASLLGVEVPLKEAEPKAAQGGPVTPK